MKTNSIIAGVFVGSLACTAGCTSGMTAHQNIHRNVNDFTSNVSATNAINNATGGATSILFTTAYFLNHIFRPSIDANSSCVNGLGQKVDCETKEVLANADVQNIDEKENE